jgi:hypothetical protein
MQVAGGDVAGPPADLGPDQPGGQPDEPEAEHERDKEAEQRQTPGLHDVRAEPAGHGAPTGQAFVG